MIVVLGLIVLVAAIVVGAPATSARELVPAYIPRRDRP
jgi:hypothetical protein